jgi:hypothetical protein
MKTHLNRSRSLRGNTLVLVLVVTAVVGFVLLAYLSLVKTQNFSTARSQAWNSAIPVIEAGVEDALTHLNINGTNNNMVCDGWQQAGNLYWIRRFINPAHHPEGYYVVTISNFFIGVNNTQPVIDSRAFMNAPSFAAANPDWMLAVVAGGETVSRSYLARAVRVNAKPIGLFMKGMVAKGNLSFGGQALVDSFDSEYTNKSTGGRYDVNKRQDKGDVASNGQIINAVAAGGMTKIYGKVSTGPGGTAGFDVNTSAGDLAWVNGGSTGIEPGYFVDDMNVEFPSVGVPFTGGYVTPGTGVYQTTNYAFLLDGNQYPKYQASSINMNSTKTMMVIGNPVLYVTGDFSMSGQSKIIIAPGASLKLYIGGTAAFTGLGIFNQTGNAINCFVYGMDSCTQIKFTGNSEFVGVIYAPSAELKLGGGGADELDFKGATITGSVTMCGKYQFHYDESLGRKGPVKGYYVTSWDEMTPQQAAALPPAIAYALGMYYPPQ